MWVEDDLDALLDGVAEIGAPGVPGPLGVYASEAFPVIVGRIRGYGSRAFPVSSIVHAPVVAAGRWQAGRMSPWVTTATSLARRSSRWTRGA